MKDAPVGRVEFPSLALIEATELTVKTIVMRGQKDLVKIRPKLTPLMSIKGWWPQFPRA